MASLLIGFLLCRDELSTDVSFSSRRGIPAYQTALRGRVDEGEYSALVHWNLSEDVSGQRTCSVVAQRNSSVHQQRKHKAKIQTK